MKDCIRCVTIEPAKQFGLEGAGALDEDSVADITVFEESDSESVFKDRFANEVIGRKQLVPKMTIIDGQILYRAIDL